jgi:hypothetical protein
VENNYRSVLMILIMHILVVANAPLVPRDQSLSARMCAGSLFLSLPSGGQLILSRFLARATAIGQRD